MDNTNYIWLRKSIYIWDHYPAEDEILEKVDPEKDPVIRMFPESHLKMYLDTYGLKISYNGMEDNPKYLTELIYYLDANKKPVFGEIEQDHIQVYLI